MYIQLYEKFQVLSKLDCYSQEAFIPKVVITDLGCIFKLQ